MSFNILFPALPGENKDSANGEAAGQGGKKSSATRMVTRLRNPESKLSQLKNQQVAAAVHEANKGFKEGKEVRVMMIFWGGIEMLFFRAFLWLNDEIK